MKRIERNPEKFEVINLFDEIARKHNLKLNDPDSQKTFFDLLSKEFGSGQSNPITVHGKRVESMFVYVAASLGKCVLIKREDSGDICSMDSDICPPDFRLVLDGGNEIFVEVKNCHKGDPNYRYQLTGAYLTSLEKYAQLFGRELWIAVFWSRWKTWTLISPQDFRKQEKVSSISFREAMMQNCMATLGDLMVGTTPPLTFRVVADPAKSRALDATGKVNFTIGNVELYCNGQLITEPFEKGLAFYFMLYSNWVSEKLRAEVVDNNLVYIEYLAKPLEPTPNQGFEMLGALSNIISHHYNDLTTSEGKIVRLSPSRGPGTLGVLIPPGYKGKQLPLWRFTLLPSEGVPGKN